jgi:hypothetical protein
MEEDMFAVPKHKKNPLVLIGAGLGVRRRTFVLRVCGRRCAPPGLAWGDGEAYR